MGTNKKKYEYRTEVECRQCGRRWMKLTASLKTWKGFCSPCGNQNKTLTKRFRQSRKAVGLRARRDLTGQKFGRLTVAADLGMRDKRHWWRCRCECGNEIDILQASLTTGHGKSCGCLKREKAIGRGLVHGHNRPGHRSRAYQTWSSMIQRCTNPKAPSWSNYGGRGISVCEAWLLFPGFLRDMGEPPRGDTLERINNSGGYSPDNCRWATRSEQARNKRSNRLLTFRGETKCVGDWASALSIRRGLIWTRLRLGWSVEKALTKPVSKKHSHR